MFKFQLAMNVMNDGPLISIYHDDSFYRPLLEKFARNVAGYEERLREGLAKKNDEAVKSVAHEIKGVFGAYGFPSVAELADRLQVSYDGSASMRETADELIVLVRRVKQAYLPLDP